VRDWSRDKSRRSIESPTSNAGISFHGLIAAVPHDPPASRIMGFIRSGSSYGDNDYRAYRREDQPRGIGGLLRIYFAPMVRAVKEHGLRGLLAILIAAAVAFVPAGVLVWFNHLRFASVIPLKPGQVIVVKPERHEHEQREDRTGGNSLLSIVCDVKTGDGPVPLLQDDDPARPKDFLNDSRFVRNEMAYLRPVTDPPTPQLTPFGLLGRPPVSVWVPPGEYEVLIVYTSPRGFNDATRVPMGYPLLTAAETYTTEDFMKTDCRILLPHYDHSFAERLGTLGADGRTVAESLSTADLQGLLDGIVKTTAIPTPAGYLLDIPEPAVRHSDDHHGCSYDYAVRDGAPREWTRDQLSTLLHWLPGDEAAQPARARIEKLIDAVEWRDYFRGWYLYAAAGIAGLVFTRWGATAVVEPWRRTQSFFESLKTMLMIFLYSAGIWLLWTILTDSGGCRGAVPFRIR
jgi:hypothetical protein